MTVQLDKTFRVQITERRSGRTYDLHATGLHYESGLPGGFKTCEFTAPAGESATMYYLDDVKVFFGDDIVWEGQVEEIDGAGFSTAFTCLGYSATLKDQPLGVLFVDRAFDRWKQTDQLISLAATGIENETISYAAPVVESTDGAVLEFSIRNGDVIPFTPLSVRRATYVPPWGALARSISGKWKASAPGIPAGSQYELNIASSGRSPTVPLWDYPVPAGTAVADLVFMYPGVSSKTSGVTYEFAGDVGVVTSGTFLNALLTVGTSSAWTLTGDAYFRMFDLAVVGEIHPDDKSAILRKDQMLIDNMVRSILANRVQNNTKISTSGEAMTPGRYVVQQSTFDEQTPEEIIQALCDVVGWEWGVFENGRVYLGPVETVTALGYRDQKVFDAPPWYLSLRVEDGHDIDIKESNSQVVNQVQTIGTGQATGIRSETVWSNFNDPRCPLNNPGSKPLEIRSRMLPVPNGFGALDIAVFAAAHLNRFAAPLVTGQVTISLPYVQRVDMGTTTPFLIGVSEIGGPDTFGGRPMEYQTAIDAPLIRPGYWCHFPELETTLDDPVTNADSGMSRRPTGGLAMIRYVEVDAGDGGATVKLTLDDGSTRFDTALAQFSESRV